MTATNVPEHGADPGTEKKNGNTPKGNDTPIVDPMADFFGPPGAGHPGIVTPDDDMPDDLRALFESEGLFNKSYTVDLRELPGGLDDGNDHHLGSFRKTYPTADYLTNHFGPGTYKLVFFWQGDDPDTGRRVKRTDSHIMRISEKTRPIYKEFQRQLRIKNSKIHNEQIREAKMEKALEDDLGDALGDRDEKQSAKEYLHEITTVARELGLTSRGTDWNGILQSMAPFIPVLITAMSESRRIERERQDNFMKLLITTMNGSNSQMIELMKSQQPPSSGTEVMKEMTSMIMSSLDLKSAMEGQKETVSDKIFGVIESLAPTILSIASQPRAQQQTNPMVNMAKNYMATNPDFQQLSDPEVLSEVVTKLDSFYGWQQTDDILRVAGKTRPESCPRKAEQRYPQGDPKNTEQAEYTEQQNPENTGEDNISPEET